MDDGQTKLFLGGEVAGLMDVKKQTLDKQSLMNMEKEQLSGACSSEDQKVSPEVRGRPWKVLTGAVPTRESLSREFLF